MKFDRLDIIQDEKLVLSLKFLPSVDGLLKLALSKATFKNKKITLPVISYRLATPGQDHGINIICDDINHFVKAYSRVKELTNDIQQNTGNAEEQPGTRRQLRPVATPGGAI
mgnify:CR=1 FL=1